MHVVFIDGLLNLSWQRTDLIVVVGPGAELKVTLLLVERKEEDIDDTADLEGRRGVPLYLTVRVEDSVRAVCCLIRSIGTLYIIIYDKFTILYIYTIVHTTCKLSSLFDKWCSHIQYLITIIVKLSNIR